MGNFWQNMTWMQRIVAISSLVGCLIVAVWAVGKARNQSQTVNATYTWVGSIAGSTTKTARAVETLTTTVQKQFAADTKARGVAEAMANNRMTIIRSIHAAFTPQRNDGWMTELTTGQSAQPAALAATPTLFQRACEQHRRFTEMDNAMDNVVPGNAHRIMWSETGVEKKKAEEMHWNAGVAAAMSLAETLRSPSADRAKAVIDNCINFRALEVGAAIKNILEYMRAEPKHIGMPTPKVLRQFVVYGLRGDITEARKGGPEKLQEILKQIPGGGWEFTGQELGLATEEAKLIEKPKSTEKK